MLYLIMNDTETGGSKILGKISVGARPHGGSGGEVHEKILKRWNVK